MWAGYRWNKAFLSTSLNEACHYCPKFSVPPAQNPYVFCLRRCSGGGEAPAVGGNFVRIAQLCLPEWAFGAFYNDRWAVHVRVHKTECSSAGPVYPRVKAYKKSCALRTALLPADHCCPDRTCRRYTSHRPSAANSSCSAGMDHQTPVSPRPNSPGSIRPASNASRTGSL